MGSLLHDLTIRDHKYDIRPLNGCQVVRDHHAGLAFHQPIQRLKNHLLRGRVQTRCRLVENQNRGIPYDGARNSDTLPLAPR